MIVLDSSAILAVLQQEPGHPDLDLLLDTQPCAVPRTCTSEVISRLMRGGADVVAARQDLDDLELIVLPFDDDVRDITAQLEARTRNTGTGFVDRSCIATGIVHDSLIVTADRDWDGLDIPEADIRQIR
ncbi:MAG: hypothetical protein JWL76_1112 [Thermoleophilia bacterium]|nr:hypothetical protein [Thermoleophilia bacterium]